eukprot:2202815-Ditylum_brightwellii.AAC.1
MLAFHGSTDVGRWEPNLFFAAIIMYCYLEDGVISNINKLRIRIGAASSCAYVLNFIKLLKEIFDRHCALWFWRMVSASAAVINGLGIIGVGPGLGGGVKGFPASYRYHPGVMTRPRWPWRPPPGIVSIDAAFSIKRW